MRAIDIATMFTAISGVVERGLPSVESAAAGSLVEWM
jgi:hypothetical protein